MKNDFKQWKDDYGLEFEPNYSKETELDCMAAFKAGQQSKQAEVDDLRKMVDDLTELNRLKTIALQQSVNRTSIHVHEKIVALERKLKGDQS